MSSEPTSEFSSPTDPHVSLAPTAALTHEGFILDNADIVALHNHAKRTADLPSDVAGIANRHGVASHAVENNRNHLESLASIYGVLKERSSPIREALNTFVDEINTDIINVSQSFENLYPQLNHKISSRDIGGVVAIIKDLHDQVRALIHKTAQAVDVLEEADKSVHYGKHHHDKLHNKAQGIFKNKDDTLDGIGGLLHPVRTIILIVDGAFSRTLVNLGIVKAEVEKGETNPDNIFSDKSADAVTRAWNELRLQAEHHRVNNGITNQY